MRQSSILHEFQKKTPTPANVCDIEYFKPAKALLSLFEWVASICHSQLTHKESLKTEHLPPTPLFNYTIVILLSLLLLYSLLSQIADHT